MNLHNLIDYKFTENVDLRFEKVFDEITETAAKICESPVAFISILGREEQYFKSRIGINRTSTKIEESICYLAVKSGKEYLEIEDLREDFRTKNFSSLVNNEKLIHYAGVPISLGNDKKIGALCTMDRKKKRLSEQQLNALKILSQQTSIFFELKEKDKLLKNLQSKLKDKTDDLDYFISTTSHDLKSPIKSIKSLLGLIAKNKIELSSTKGEVYFDLINKSADNALDLVEGIAQYGKILSTEEENVEVDVENMINSIFELVSKNYPDSNATLKLNTISTIVSQKKLLTPLFENLIDNAFKYSSKEREVSIEISQKKDEDKWLFTIEDNGIGMAKEDLKSVFKPFVRLNTKSEYKGSGLGLASVERIIQKLGGTINVESEFGEGSTFIFAITVG